MARKRRLVLVLLALLATWTGAASAASLSMATPTIARKAESTPEPSVVTFETTLAPLPTGNITTKLPGASTLPAPFLPVIEDMVISKDVAYTLSGPEVVCWYAISGNYGTLPRIMFYFTILAALLLRHHQWLYAGALVASLTYSASAAIQASVMAFVGRSWGDLDLIPIYSILGLSATLAIPLLNWSDTLRNIGRNENEDLSGPEDCVNDHNGERREQEFKRASRTIILYWLFLTGFGFLCVFAVFVPYYFNEGESVWSPVIFSTAQNLQCTPPNGVFNYALGESDFQLGVVVTQEFAEANNCLNPCSQLGNPFTLFRWSSDLQPPSLHQMNRLVGNSNNKVEAHNANLDRRFYTYGPIIFPYIFCQGVYAAIFGRRTPAQARNLFYAILTRIRLTRARLPLDPAGRRQRWAAKLIAQMAYLWAILVFIIAIPLVVIIIVAGEIYMYDLPESEHPVYIGQWIPWTDVGLALCAALIARFHDDLLYFVSVSFFKTAWLFCHPSWPYLQYWQGRGSGSLYNAKAKNIFTGDLEEMPDRGLYRRTAGNVLGRASERVGGFLSRKWRSSRDGFLGEWQQFHMFWLDPESSRSNQGRTLRLYAEPCQCAWRCSCPKTQVQGRCRHEEGVCAQGRAAHEQCSHYPACKHARQCVKARMRKQRIRALNPERRTVAMVVGPLHAGVLQLDMTKTPIPLRSMLASHASKRLGSRDEHTDASESEMDEKTTKSGVPMQAWHAGPRPHTRTRSLPGQMKRLFSRRSNTRGSSDQSRPSPMSKPSDDSRTTQHSQPMMRDPQAGEPSGHDPPKGQTVVVREGPVHPLLRDSFVSEESAGRTFTAGRPSIRPARDSEEEESRRRSMLKDLPDTPKITRTPHPTPNIDTGSVGSGVSAVSPVGVTSETPINSRGEDVSPELPSSHATLRGSSGRITNVASPVQVEEPSDEDDHYGATRSSAGLTTSFERGIMSRHRRSQVYGPDIARDRHAAGLSDSAPIPVHTEEYTDSEAGDDQEGDDEGDDADTDGELIDQQRLHGISDKPGDISSAAPSESEPPSEAPPTRKRHIAELVRFLPGPRESSGTFLSPQEKHQLLDPPSGASTPPIQLPPLSPPDPSSNAARAANLALLDRSPHLSLGSVMFTPNRQSTASMLRPSERVSGPTSSPQDTASVVEGLARIDATIKRQRSPRPPGYRSTVDYLQVHRPTTMVYADEIVLRKDEYGQYRIVMNGDQLIDQWDADKDDDSKDEKSRESTKDEKK